MKIFLTVLMFYTGVAMATEEPKYVIEKKSDQFEIRKYSSIIVAETKTNSTFENAGNEAFRILAGYIFGNNQSKTKIAMTAPVSQQTSSEKIAMTAPVTQEKSGETFLVQFTMPSSFTKDTLPLPNDPRVLIREIPERRFAVFRYSGTWSEERYLEKLKEFRSILKKENITTLGDPIFARYNPPFMPWFLRRNEIWIQL
jgi:hypothetical protein